MTTNLKVWLVLGLLLGTAVYALAEDITLTTYYPSPRGVYQELRTAGDMVVGSISGAPGARLHVIQDDPASAVPVFRADDEPSETSPFVISATGNVGIGTSAPAGRVDVRGVDDAASMITFMPGADTGAAGTPSLNVGIGTAGPSTNFEIESTGDVGILLQADSDNAGGEGDNPFIKFQQDGGSSLTGFGGVIGLAGAAGSGPTESVTDALADAFLVGTGSTTDLQLYVNNAVAMTLLDSGNVGIGTTTPAQALDVVGNVTAGRYDDRDDAIYSVDPAGTSRLNALNVDGNITAGGTVFAASDARLKMDFLPVHGALDKVEQLRGMSFAWDPARQPASGAAGTRHIGVIAQDVEAAFPELVSSWGPDGYKAVDYGGLTAVLLEAIKELRQENATLQQRLELLERRMGAPEDGS